jgi:uncharacterized protein YlxW (UPF0749 family)
MFVQLLISKTIPLSKARLRFVLQEACPQVLLQLYVLAAVIRHVWKYAQVMLLKSVTAAAYSWTMKNVSAAVNAKLPVLYAQLILIQKQKNRLFAAIAECVHVIVRTIVF